MTRPFDIIKPTKNIAKLYTVVASGIYINDVFNSFILFVTEDSDVLKLYCFEDSKVKDIEDIDLLLNIIYGLVDGVVEIDGNKYKKSNDTILHGKQKALLTCFLSDYNIGNPLDYDRSYIKCTTRFEDISCKLI